MNQLSFLSYSAMSDMKAGISLHVSCHFMASQLSFQSFTPIFLPQVPNAPPAYDKIAAEQSPPPYSP